jgi:ABC-2 type transport system ATP-binding protein
MSGGEVAADDPVIKTEDLTRTFKHTTAVDRLNLSVRHGEIFGLVGPDGAGKTTTLRLLAAILDPTDGQATVLGYDTVKQPEPIKQRIGYMAQRFNLYGDLSVSENLNFFADVFQVTGDVRRERIERLLGFSRLTGFRDRRAAHLSGGMQKKLALACTLIHTPEIIYLDEPTTGVDPVSRREFWDILTELYLQGITLVVSTPYMDEAERCSRVGLMYQGRMVICDTPERIREMIEGELIALRPSDLRRAREILAELPGVLEMQTFGNQLRIFARDAGAMIERVQAALTEQDIGVLDVRRTRPRMEEAFISLVRRQEARSGNPGAGRQEIA